MSTQDLQFGGPQIDSYVSMNFDDKHVYCQPIVFYLDHITYCIGYRLSGRIYSMFFFSRNVGIKFYMAMTVSLKTIMFRTIQFVRFP